MKTLVFLMSLMPSLLFAQSKAFCHKDLFGTTTKIELHNQGKGKILIEENNVKQREGSITWSMTTNRFPNPEILRIRLSTGVYLTFEVIRLNQPNQEIDMIIDSKGNQFLKCDDLINFDYDDSEESKYWEKVYDENAQREINFMNAFTKFDFLDAVKGTWVVRNVPNTHIYITSSETEFNLKVIEGDSTNYREIEWKEKDCKIDDMFYYVEDTYRSAGKFDWKIALLFKRNLKKVDWETDGIRIDYENLEKKNLIDVMLSGVTYRLEKINDNSIRTFVETEKPKPVYLNYSIENDSLNYYNKIQINPNDTNAYLEFSSVYFEKITNIITEMNELGTSEEENLRYEKLSAMRAKYYTQAAFVLEQGLLVDPTNESFLKRLLTCYGFNGDRANYSRIRELLKN